MLATLEAPVYIERVGTGDNKQSLASRAIKRAVEKQVKGLGFSLIECWRPANNFKMNQSMHSTGCATC